MLNGKKSDRVMLRVSEAMAAKIRATAELDGRSVQDQVRWLIATALKQAGTTSSNETRTPERQQMSLPTFAEQEAKQQPYKPVSSRQQSRRQVA